MSENENAIIERTKVWVEPQLKDCDVGHDFWHVQRVFNNAIFLCNIEGGNRFIILMAALLHDVVDEKYFNPHQKEFEIKKYLTSEGLAISQINEILNIITNMSFSNEFEGNKQKFVEFKIVQDADRLDAIGAIGIARAFSYGNHHNRIFFDPSVLPIDVKSKNEYRKSVSPTLNHFFEKLLLLKNLMNTETGKEIAIQRARFMIDYLKQFINEYNVINKSETVRWFDLIKMFE
ncbi:MAG: HD domain-containing protein [Marinilabiliaceae bacterium]|nr:HD domain-containing protein [Marinilabiliaceae bacterium]